MNIYRPFLELAESEAARLRQWCHRDPLLISSGRYVEMLRVQQLLYRAIRYFVDHYFEFPGLMPVASQVEQILHCCGGIPYRIGTYRPDFLIGVDDRLHICEINARFPLNGYFASGVFERIAAGMAAERGIRRWKPEFRNFTDYLQRYFGGMERVCVLKGSDRPQDIRSYVPVFTKAGATVSVISARELAEGAELREGDAIVNELNQMEMLSLPAEVIRRIAIGNGLNDLRTIFLIHDKRFLAVLSNRDFLARCLMPQEAGFLSQYIVPTYAWGERADLWEQARDCKHDWIVKPALLGKSEKVFAGSVTSDEAWRAVFETDLAKEMVLQPMIAQRQFSTLTETGPHFDYAVGTMLCFDNMFFGPGLLRTSSFPVTNQGDDRKMAALITDETDPLSTAPVL